MDPVSYPHSDITLKMPEYWDQHPCPEHHALPLFLAPPYFPYFLLSASSPVKKILFLAFLGVLLGGFSGFLFKNLWETPHLCVPSSPCHPRGPYKRRGTSSPTLSGHPRISLTLSQTEAFVFLLSWGRAEWLTGNMNLGREGWKNIDFEMLKLYLLWWRLTKCCLDLLPLPGRSRRWNFPVIFCFKRRPTIRVVSSQWDVEGGGGPHPQACSAIFQWCTPHPAPLFVDVGASQRKKPEPLS